jgi:3-oxoacyl-[acyl-carrier-protein] reductase
MDCCVLVIGGSGEIGQTIVEKILQQGDYVVATYNSRQIPSKEGLFTKQLDIELESSLQDLAEYIKLLGYKVSKIVYNTGVTKDELFWGMDELDFLKVLNINLLGFYRVCKLFLPDVSLCRGSVVSISSIAALISSKGQSNYACSKAALISLTRSIACEYAKLGVRSNSVIPGWIDSTMIESMTADTLDSIRRSIPLRRIGNAEDVANAVSFLLSEESSYITGQTIVVDGGVTSLRV